MMTIAPFFNLLLGGLRFAHPRRQGAFTVCTRARRIFENTTIGRIAADFVQFPKADAMSVRRAVARTALAPATMTWRTVGTGSLPHGHRPNRDHGDPCRTSDPWRAPTRVHHPLPDEAGYTHDPAKM